MSGYYDGVDLFWDTGNGDFALSADGDLASTDFDPLQSILQDVCSRVKGERGEWLDAPLIGASLSEFSGERNTREIGNAIKKRVISALGAYGTVSASDISIEVYPTSPSVVAIDLQLRVQPTRANRNSRVIKKTFIYNFIENNIYPRA